MLLFDKFNSNLNQRPWALRIHCEIKSPLTNSMRTNIPLFKLKILYTHHCCSTVRYGATLRFPNLLYLKYDVLERYGATLMYYLIISIIFSHLHIKLDNFLFTYKLSLPEITFKINFTIGRCIFFYFFCLILKINGFLIYNPYVILCHPTFSQIQISFPIRVKLSLILRILNKSFSLLHVL